MRDSKANRDRRDASYQKVVEQPQVYLVYRRNTVIGVYATLESARALVTAEREADAPELAVDYTISWQRVQGGKVGQ